MIHQPLVRIVPVTSVVGRTFRSDTNEEAPWSPKTDTTPGYNAFYGSLKDDSESGRWQWKGCEHYKVSRTRKTLLISGFRSQVENQPPTIYWKWGNTDPNWIWINPDVSSARTGVNTFGAMVNPVKDLPLLFDEDRQVALSQSLPTDLAGLVSRGISTMSPGIRSEMSLLNSIFELKDFKSLPQRILRTKQLITKIPRKGSLRNAAYTLKNIAKAVAGLTLEQEFNLRPLAQEVAFISAALRAARFQLNQLEAGANRIHKRHFQTYLDDYKNRYEVADYDLIPSYLYWPTNVSATRNVSYSVRQLNVTMEYSYKLPSASLAGREIDALLDVLGVNLNPAIVWNAIPWSFVVDWVFGVSKYLEGFKVRHIEPVMHIHRCVHSVKIKRAVNCALILNGTTHPTFELIEESYRRFVTDLNVVNASLQTSGLSSRELGLTVALGIVRS